MDSETTLKFSPPEVILGGAFTKCSDSINIKVDVKLKILHIEDLHSDVLLIANAIKKAKINFDVLVVDNKDTFITALKDFSPDVVLCDHSLPSFNSVEALTIFHETGMKIPFIVVTANVSEEFAVDILKMGADDYILKNRLTRLPAAILSAIESIKARGKLIETELRFRRLIETAQEGVWTVDEKGCTSFVNEKMCEILGYSSDEMMGKKFIDFMDDEGKAIATELLERQRHENINDFEFKFISKSGKAVWTKVATNPIFENPKEYKGALAMVSDITERKIAQNDLYATATELGKANTDLNKIMDSSLDVICTINSNGEFVMVSRASRTVWGYTPKELIGTKFMDLVYGEDVDKTLEAAEIIVKNIQVPIFENRYVHKSGRVIPMLWSVNWDQVLQLMFCIAKDVSELKKVENILKSSEEVNRTILESSPDCLKVIDNEGRLQFMNSNGCKLMEVDDFNSIKNKYWWDMWGDENKQIVRDSVKKSLEGKAAHFEAFSPTLKGNAKWWDVKLSPVSKTAQGLDQIISVSRDITEKKQMEERDIELQKEIKQKTVSLEEAQQIAHLGNWEWDIASNNLKWSEEMYRIFGFTPGESEITYEKFLERIHPDDRDSTNQLVKQAAEQKKSQDYFYRILRKNDGMVRVIHGRRNVLLDEKGNLVKMIGIGQDVTEAKAASQYSRSIIEASLDPMITISPEEKITDVNEASAKITGVPTEELKGSYFFDYFTEPKKAREVYQEVFTNGYVANSPLTIRHKFGTLTNVLFNGSVYKDELENVLGVVIVARDITEIKKNEEAFISKTNQLIEAQAMAHIGSWEWDVIAKKVMWSDELFKIFGYAPQEFKETYTDYLNHVHRDDILQLNGIMQKAFTDLQPFELYHRVVTKNGTERILLGIGNVVGASEGKILKMTGTIQDVTEIKKAEKALIKAQQSAEEASLLKEAFLANMSHEIRTPLNAIIGYTDLLLKRNLGNQENDFVRTIKISGENLLQIINDVLDVSKIESGSMIFEHTPLSIKDLFISLNLMLSQKAKEKNLNLLFVCENNVPDVLLGDTTRLSQILINLAGNAIKFTHKGSVDVFAKTVSEENEIVQVEFSVTDTGIGIPEDKQQYIFERFRQAESHTSRNFGGTGLGLSIARQLVELQGGKLTVKSKEGMGSVFSFSLPFKKSKETRLINGEVRVDINTQELSKLNVLIVEDNSVNISFITILFSEYGIKTDIAKNGKIAVEKIKSNQYDLVLMDIEMPEMNGYEATVAIRNDLKNNIPIIAMSAHAMSGEKEKCIKVGMNDYVSKPINPNLLFERILFFTSDSTKTLNIKSKEKVIDLTYLFDSVSGKKHLMLELFDIFLQQIPADLMLINEAVLKADYLKIKQISHRMKSTVSVMGISILDPVLQQMEVLGAAAIEIEKIKALNEQLNEICNTATEEIELEKKSILIKNDIA